MDRQIQNANFLNVSEGDKSITPKSFTNKHIRGVLKYSLKIQNPSKKSIHLTSQIPPSPHQKKDSKRETLLVYLPAGGSEVLHTVDS